MLGLAQTGFEPVTPDAIDISLGFPARLEERYKIHLLAQDQTRIESMIAAALDM